MATEEGLEQLGRLEEKIFRTIDLLQAARAEKEEWRRENTQLRRQLVEQDQLLRTLQQRVARLEKEREGVRVRVQKLIEQADSFTPAGSEA